MNYIKTAVFSLIAVCGMSVSFAATAEAKIAICDIGRAIVGSEMAQKRFEVLSGESNLGKMKAKSDGIIADMDALKKDFDTNNLSWDQARKDKAQREMTSYQAELQLLERDFKVEQQSVQQSVIREIEPVVFELLQVIIDEEKIDVLMKKEAILWNKGAFDITDKLIDRINKSASSTEK